MTVVIVLAIVAVLFALFLSRHRPSKSRAERLLSLFHLSPEQYRLLGSDLSGGRDKIWLSGYGLLGVPDAVFERIEDGHILIGEFKSRAYRGAVSNYERNQVLLYIGLARKKYRSQASGLILYGRYGCSYCVPIAYSANAFQRLVNLVPECKKAIRRFHPS